MPKAGTVSGVAAFFKDEHALLVAAEKTYKAGYRRFDTLSPFPIHGMDDAMGLKRSFLPWVTFFAGLFGCSFGLWFQWYTGSYDWPINIGGKPFFSLPAFIPVMFELTILIGGLSTVGALFAVCRLPKVDPPIIDKDLTSHKFAIFIPENDVGYDVSRAEGHLKSLGATEVRQVAEF